MARGSLSLSTWRESRQLIVRDAQIQEDLAPADLRRDRHQLVLVQEHRLPPPAATANRVIPALLPASHRALARAENRCKLTAWGDLSDISGSQGGWGARLDSCLAFQGDVVGQNLANMHHALAGEAPNRRVPPPMQREPSLL